GEEGMRRSRVGQALAVEIGQRGHAEADGLADHGFDGTCHGDSPMPDVYSINITRMVTVSTSEKRSYHHGDLRAAAIAAGLELLKSRTADDLGLREVARAVGTSATALYRHFPDKAALLRALAKEGLHRL